MTSPGSGPASVSRSLRKRKGLTRPVLAGLVGMSASWLKGIERGSRLPPRLPLLVKLAEALAVGDLAVLAGTDLDLGATSVPVLSSARIPHDAVPAIREAVRDPLLVLPDSTPDVAALAARTADARRLWRQSPQRRTDVGRVLPRLVTDARRAASVAGAAISRDDLHLVISGPHPAPSVPRRFTRAGRRNAPPPLADLRQHLDVSA